MQMIMSPLFPFLLFVAFIAIFILPGVLKRQAENRHNATQPLTEREAYVVSRRQQVRGHKATRTYYFVTFQFRDGSRQEFAMEGPQYGLLAEGDTGVLQSQGTWYKSFLRKELP